MSLEELEYDYAILLARVQGVNQWIENNLFTDPNFYEMVDCRMEFCDLVRKYYSYIVQEGTMVEDEGKTRRANGYDVFKLNPELFKIEEELKKMYDMRKDSPFFQEELPNKLIRELDYLAKTAALGVSEMGDNAKAIAQTSGVYFYIWQQQQNDSEFKYSNEYEFKGIQERIEDMKGTGVYYIDDVVDTMMDGIKKNSQFYEDDYSSAMTM